MNRKIAISLLVFFSYGIMTIPANAILDRKKVQEHSVLNNINYDFWQKTDDEHLQKYIKTAIEKNHDIKIAKLNIEKAKYNVMQQRSNQLPKLSISASPLEAKMPGTTQGTGVFALPIMTQYEIDLFGKNANKTKSKKILLKSEEFKAQSSEIAVASMVGATYYNIVKLDKMIELQENLVKERKDIYDLMKISNHEGIISTQDLISSEKSYVLSQNDLLDYKKARENALNALAVLIGDSAENTKEYQRVNYDKLPENLAVPEKISSDIIVNRPDYKALEKQLESAGIDIKVAKKEFLPTIDVLGILTFLTGTMGGMNWQNSLALIGGQASLPIFTGLSRVANLKLKQNEYKSLLEQYQKTNLTAIQEVNDALYNLKNDKEKLENNLKALNIQNKDYGLSQQKYKYGVISKLDLMQQHETLLYIQQLMVSSRMDCYVDKISLYKATGAKI